MEKNVCQKGCSHKGSIEKTYSNRPNEMNENVKNDGDECYGCRIIVKVAVRGSRRYGNDGRRVPRPTLSGLEYKCWERWER